MEKAAVTAVTAKMASIAKVEWNKPECSEALSQFSDFTLSVKTQTPVELSLLTVPLTEVSNLARRYVHAAATTDTHLLRLVW